MKTVDFFSFMSLYLLKILRLKNVNYLCFLYFHYNIFLKNCIFGNVSKGHFNEKIILSILKCIYFKKKAVFLILYFAPFKIISGATEVLGTFSGFNLNMPVYAGEIQAPSLGVDIQCFDETGRVNRFSVKLNREDLDMLDTDIEIFLIFFCR